MIQLAEAISSAVILKSVLFGGKMRTSLKVAHGPHSNEGWHLSHMRWSGFELKFLSLQINIQVLYRND